MGLKLYRVYVMMKEIGWNLMENICPARVVFARRINRGGRQEIITDQEGGQVNAFLFLYLLVFAAGTFVFCCFGYSVEDSMFEFASALSTVGLSVGITAFDADPVIHWTATAGMFLGRLEIYVVMISAARMLADGKDALKKRQNHGGKERAKR